MRSGTEDPRRALACAQKDNQRNGLHEYIPVAVPIRAGVQEWRRYDRATTPTGNTPMSLARFALAVAAGLAVSCTAAAHSELHSADWCTDGVVAYAGQFSITSDDLHAESDRQQAAVERCRQETGQPDPTSGSVGTCGIFDPPYELAVAMARVACGDLESPTPAHGSPVVVFIVSPQTFNDPNHHTAFNLDTGLTGICGYYVIGTPIPRPNGQN